MTVRGKNTVNPLWINEYFNNAKAKILPLKSGSDYSHLLIWGRKGFDRNFEAWEASGGVGPP